VVLLPHSKRRARALFSSIKLSNRPDLIAD
jgi:hypothetical protein